MALACAKYNIETQFICGCCLKLSLFSLLDLWFVHISDNHVHFAYFCAILERAIIWARKGICENIIIWLWRI